jgi:hypothetical protein
LHTADGGKDIARRAAELHGGAFIKLPFVSGFFTPAAVCLLYSGENRYHTGTKRDEERFG